MGLEEYSVNKKHVCSLKWIILLSKMFVLTGLMVGGDKWVMAGRIIVLWFHAQWGGE